MACKFSLESISADGLLLIVDCTESKIIIDLWMQIDSIRPGESIQIDLPSSAVSYGA